MKQSTISAVMANSIKNLLQGYTKGIRLLLVMFLTLTITTNVWAETKTEGFEKATAAQNYQGTVNLDPTRSDCGIGWTIYYGCVSTSSKISGNNSAALRLYTSNNYGYLKTTTPIDGLSNVTFKAKAATSNSAKIKVNISYSKDGDTWTNIKSDETYGTTSQSKSYDIPSGGKYFQIAISSNSTKPTKSNAQLTIDDVVFTYTSTSTPVDPTASFSNGNYTVGQTLDLSTLWTSNSDGAVTYSVTDAGTTGASISGSSFTATAAGTCTVKASQAATSTYNAVEKTATITVTCSNQVTITKASATGGSFKVHQGTASGTEISSGGKIDNCDANAVVVVVPTANANYTCTGVTATNSNSISEPDGNGNYTITYTKDSNISSEISVTFTENQKHHVTWIVNGNEYTEGTPTASVYEGAKWSSLTLPTAPNPNDYCGKVFAGWTTTNIGSTGLDKDNDATAIQNLNLMTSENKSSKTNTITEPTTFYAVFADYE